MRKNRLGHSHMRGFIAQRAQRGDADALQRVALHGLRQQFGAMQLAHHPRHRPALACHIARRSAAKLFAACIAASFLQIRILQKAMQKRRMRRVHAHLKTLQPIGMPKPFEGKTVRGWGSKAIELWHGLGRRVIEPSPDHASFFLHRIAALPDVLAHR